MIYAATAHAGPTIIAIPPNHTSKYNRNLLKALFTNGKNSLSFARVIIVC